MKRAVRVHSQLKSHKMFANAFPNYCHLVDNAKLYCTNGIGVPPQVSSYCIYVCSLYFLFILKHSTMISLSFIKIRRFTFDQLDTNFWLQLVFYMLI